MFFGSVRFGSAKARFGRSLLTRVDEEQVVVGCFSWLVAISHFPDCKTGKGKKKMSWWTKTVKEKSINASIPKIPFSSFSYRFYYLQLTKILSPRLYTITSICDNERTSFSFFLLFFRPFSSLFFFIIKAEETEAAGWHPQRLCSRRHCVPKRERCSALNSDRLFPRSPLSKAALPLEKWLWLNVRLLRVVFFSVYSRKGNSNTGKEKGILCREQKV